ncbi:DUF1919 domain-containing protein [Aerococcaceae bacterium zg-ZJ1578]|uniref:DUF1919 domain-containing protein n=1 Tax=Aerococcaceae bacterium zg-252 TaxID=2796928 RepID=UPI001A315462|nr:DUF1919 domain-containing protein [Aerococcaceae bacterium zg-1578]
MIKNILFIIERKIKIFYWRMKLKNKDFTIITNNCWGGRVYEELNLPFNTPFIGLYLYAEDYLTVIKNLKQYMEMDLYFTQTSRFKQDYDNSYPVGNLGGVELHFVHYSSEVEALEKWNRRKQRINYDNLFVKFNDDNQCTYEHLKEFDSLDLNHKVIFSATNYPELKSLVFFKETRPLNSSTVGEDLEYYHKYFDVAKWLNEGVES